MFAVRSTTNLPSRLQHFVLPDAEAYGFAREELGRSTILLNFRRKVLAGGKFTLNDIQDQCDDHVTKQKAAMLSVVFTADRDSGLGKLMRVRMEQHPQSAEWKKADAEIKRIQDAKKKRIPSDRHRSRMSALYVEPVSDIVGLGPATLPLIWRANS